ncbi:alpha/beta fold hydrolase [Umezawaea sp. NPDC059074]|uniref:alpha/beta fold hydrolase n=1 Tax=Umezawaea sp. NPDC059074 TaxID=3346716 RepID=UPI0036C380DD
MPQNTYVMVPGAWHGGWSWRPVAERLRAAGHRVVTLTLPGLGDGDDPANRRLSDAVDHVVAEVERLDLSAVVLVGHSWGGYVITGAAHRLVGRVAKVVYYSAHVPVRGRSLVDDNPPESAAFLRGLIDSSPDGSIAPTLGFVRQLFLQDSTPETQRLVADLLVPQPGGYFLDALDVDDVTTLGIPALYVLSEDDHALPLPGAEYAARIGLEPVLVPGAHDGLLTHPDEIAKALV